MAAILDMNNTGLLDVRVLVCGEIIGLVQEIDLVTLRYKKLVYKEGVPLEELEVVEGQATDVHISRRVEEVRL
jgi:hypothetical protein